MRVVRGAPDADELAALVAVLLSRARRVPPVAAVPRRRRPDRGVFCPPTSWRASTEPNRSW
nr:acyl-CoA carboxylase subunit epsilon [Actinomadura rayongensis]